MKWANLRLNKCPKCNADLKGNGQYVGCTKCDFRINTEKMESIVTSVNKQKYKNESEEQIESFYRN